MRQLDAEFEAVHADEFNSDAVPMRPERLCKELSKSLPSDALFLADTGQASWWSGMFLDLTSPDQSFLRANGSLGWAFPAALGAKMGIGNERPVIAFIGDGGFYYYMAELETALRTGTNIVVVLNDNASLGACVTFSDIYYDRVGVEGAGSIYDHLQVDFAAVAEQIGANSIRVEKPQDFAGAMEKALSNNRITVIHVRTDPEVRCPWDISNFQ
jgi:acetolactate synthase-1/2/3 large subunit